MDAYFKLAKVDQVPTDNFEGLGYYKCFCEKVKKEKLNKKEYNDLCSIYKFDKG